MTGSSLTPFLGSEFDDDAIDAALARWGLAWERVPDPELRAASLLADGRIVAWFQGRMEFGPRALGNRSLLADPRNLGNARKAQPSHQASGVRSGHLPLRSWRKRRQPGLSSPRIGQGRGLRETSCSWLILSAPTRDRDSGSRACRRHMPDSNRQPAAPASIPPIDLGIFSKDGGAPDPEHLLQ